MTYHLVCECIFITAHLIARQRRLDEKICIRFQAYTGPLHYVHCYFVDAADSLLLLLLFIQYRTAYPVLNTGVHCTALKALSTSHTFRIIESASLTTQQHAEMFVNSLTMQLHRHRHFPVLIRIARTTEQNAKHANHR